jgi:hypothetical protein
MTSLQETSKSEKEQIEVTLALLKANNEKMEDKLQGSAQEILKGNNIIQKLQVDYKTLKQKLKIKNSIVTQQEQVIEQQKQNINQISRGSEETKREVERKNETIKSDHMTINDLKAKLEESQKVLESNNQSKLERNWNELCNERCL